MFEAAPHPHLVPYDGSFRSADAPTRAPRGAGSAKSWKDGLDAERKTIGKWQHKQFADGRFALLLIFQALDAAGKDSTIRHVFSRVNPSGLRVASFKQPSHLELAHDFLWRTTQQLPQRGEMALFNRSYYEEVLVVRVHPELLGAQRLPKRPSAAFWADRCRAIAEHERHLAENGTVILKFWLNISKREQRKRLLERLDEPDKRWKFRVGDLDERALWDDYQAAYEQCINATSQPWAPWYAIPADDEGYLRWQVAALVNAAFEQLGVDYPQPRGAELKALKQARARLAKDRHGP